MSIAVIIKSPPSMPRGPSTSPSIRKEVRAPKTGSIVKIRATCEADVNFCMVVCTQKAKAVQNTAENMRDQKLGTDTAEGNGSNIRANAIPNTETKNN